LETAQLPGRYPAQPPILNSVKEPLPVLCPTLATAYGVVLTPFVLLSKKKKLSPLARMQLRHTRGPRSFFFFRTGLVYVVLPTLRCGAGLFTGKPTKLRQQ